MVPVSIEFGQSEIKETTKLPSFHGQAICSKRSGCVQPVIVAQALRNLVEYWQDITRQLAEFLVLLAKLGIFRLLIEYSHAWTK